jgi:uncharacterized lipoprotein YajG
MSITLILATAAVWTIVLAVPGLLLVCLGLIGYQFISGIIDDRRHQQTLADIQRRNRIHVMLARQAMQQRRLG